MIKKIKNFKNTPLIMFGASIEGMAINVKLLQWNIKLHCIIDNSSVQQGSYKNDILINPPEYILSLDNYYVIIPSCHYDDMKEQLLCMGVDKKKIWRVEQFNKTYNEIDMPIMMKFYVWLHKINF